MKLKLLHKETISPKAPYNFKYSTQNPSHYPVPIGDNTDAKMWFTMRWKREPIGITLTNKGSLKKPKVEVTIYSKKKLDYKQILKELEYKFEWNEDYSELYSLLNKKFLDIVKKFKGMRNLCTEDLYGYLMIAILLQHAPVKRSAKMTQIMLERYGDLLEFDGKKFYCFWAPERILKISEEELRSLKVGYRAKSFLRASQDFLKSNEFEMRNLNDKDLRKALLSIYGVGPASLDYLMKDIFHRKFALDTVPPWEAKIYSKMLKVETTEPKKLLELIKKEFGAWRAYAIHYLFMDLNWKHKQKPIEWYGKLMPY